MKLSVGESVSVACLLQVRTGAFELQVHEASPFPPKEAVC